MSGWFRFAGYAGVVLLISALALAAMPPARLIARQDVAWWAAVVGLGLVCIRSAQVAHQSRGLVRRALLMIAVGVCGLALIGFLSSPRLLTGGAPPGVEQLN